MSEARHIKATFAESGEPKPLLTERLREEFDALGMLSYHGGPTPDLWWADLTKQDIEEIRELIRDAGHALEALRSAWNAHMETCPQHAALSVPTWEEMERWRNAPSGTASAGDGQKGST